MIQILSLREAGFRTPLAIRENQERKFALGCGKDLHCKSHRFEVGVDPGILPTPFGSHSMCLWERGTWQKGNKEGDLGSFTLMADGKLGLGLSSC